MRGSKIRFADADTYAKYTTLRYEFFGLHERESGRIVSQHKTVYNYLLLGSDGDIKEEEKCNLHSLKIESVRHK